MPGDDPIHGSRHRVRVFVDFWNYTLSMRDAEEALVSRAKHASQV